MAEAAALPAALHDDDLYGPDRDSKASRDNRVRPCALPRVRVLPPCQFVVDELPRCYAEALMAAPIDDAHRALRAAIRGRLHRCAGDTRRHDRHSEGRDQAGTTEEIREPSYVRRRVTTISAVTARDSAPLISCAGRLQGQERRSMLGLAALSCVLPRRTIDPRIVSCVQGLARRRLRGLQQLGRLTTRGAE